MTRPRWFLIALGLVGLLLLSVTAAAAREPGRRPPPPAHRGKPTAWTPFRITQTVAAGQTAQVTASFVSSTELHDVNVVIPGGLGRIVTAAPAHFVTVAANTPTTVTFTITMVAQGAHTQGGVVHLRSGQRLVSLPLHVWVGVSGTPSDDADDAPGHPKHPPHGPKKG
jgi:hypothetical protein